MKDPFCGSCEIRRVNGEDAELCAPCQAELADELDKLLSE